MNNLLKYAPVGILLAEIRRAAMDLIVDPNDMARTYQYQNLAQELNSRGHNFPLSPTEKDLYDMVQMF